MERDVPQQPAALADGFRRTEYRPPVKERSLGVDGSVIIDCEQPIGAKGERYQPHEAGDNSCPLEAAAAPRVGSGAAEGPPATGQQRDGSTKHPRPGWRDLRR